MSQPYTYPSGQRMVNLVISIDEDGDRALFAQHPNGIDEWLCGSAENPRSCYSTYVAELNMLCYGKATTRIDLVLEYEGGGSEVLYKPAGRTFWRAEKDGAYLAYANFVGIFLFHGVRYYLR